MLIIASQLYKIALICHMYVATGETPRLVYTYHIFKEALEVIQALRHRQNDFFMFNNLYIYFHW